MSANHYQPHIVVRPEDDALAAIVRGFLIEKENPRQVDILRPSGGRDKVLGDFADIDVRALAVYPMRLVVLLTDFDNNVEMWAKRCKSKIPEELADRVFVLGPKGEAEAAKRSLQCATFEPAGALLARDCASEATSWQTDQFRHNLPELRRLLQRAGGIFAG